MLFVMLCIEETEQTRSVSRTLLKIPFLNGKISKEGRKLGFNLIENSNL